MEKQPLAIFHLIDSQVIIDMVFDTRQSPKKMKPGQVR